MLTFVIPVIVVVIIREQVHHGVIPLALSLHAAVVFRLLRHVTVVLSVTTMTRCV